MKSIAFEEWDNGRLVVNREFASILRANGLETFHSLMQFEGGDVAKNLLRERTTTRITLKDSAGTERAFYIKRHGPPPWKEYVKPLLRLTRPMLGARHEWNAILQFHEAGIPTMTPVALGESGGESFLLTAALDGCTKLSHWAAAHHECHNGKNGERNSRYPFTVKTSCKDNTRQSRAIIQRLACIARKMHGAGLHHQDFYLTHFLVPNDGPPENLFVIDLGRARRCRNLPTRWVVKDLAQLDYSASAASLSDKARFLKAYLGRRPSNADRSLLRRIQRKSRAIARHSSRHGL